MSEWVNVSLLYIFPRNCSNNFSLWNCTSRMNWVARIFAQDKSFIESQICIISAIREQIFVLLVSLYIILLLYVYACIYISQIPACGPDSKQHLTTKFEPKNFLNTLLECLIMEFGNIRMALKYFTFLPGILVIFSIASFLLSILYAKVSVKNIRRGVREGGDIFRKTGIVVLFTEAVIGEDIPGNSCARYSCIHAICIVFVFFHSPTLMYYQHSSKNL